MIKNYIDRKDPCPYLTVLSETDVSWFIAPRIVFWAQQGLCDS